MLATQAFGRTGHISSRILLGAAAFWDVPQAVADESIETALAAGVNHVDTAASYGQAELRLGSWIQRHGRPFFLATKTGERSAVKAREEIHRSLERLQVDSVDLIQLHNLIDPQEWETALGPGGALEAAIQAREEGLVRFIGVTGHGLTAPQMHRRALEVFDFDSVLLPFNFIMAQDAAYREAFHQLTAACRQRGTAVQIIKSLLHRPWGDQPHTRTTWYQPLEDQADIERAVGWILGQEGLFLNTAGDVNILPRILQAASRFAAPPDEAEMRAMFGRLDMQPLFTE